MGTGSRCVLRSSWDQNFSAEAWWTHWAMVEWVLGQTIVLYTSAPCPGFPYFEGRDSRILRPNCNFSGFPRRKSRESQIQNLVFRNTSFRTFVRNSPIFSWKSSEIRVDIIIQFNYVLPFKYNWNCYPSIIITLHTLHSPYISFTLCQTSSSKHYSRLNFTARYPTVLIIECIVYKLCKLCVFCQREGRTLI